MYGFYQLILMGFESLTFFMIYFMLNKNHRYEFERNKYCLKIQYALALMHHIPFFLDYLNILSEWSIFGLILSYLPPVLFCLKFLAITLVKSHIDIL